MAFGPGKYDADCTGGAKGDGFEVQMVAELAPTLLATLPKLLRELAGQIQQTRAEAEDEARR